MANEEFTPEEEPVSFTDKRKIDPESGEVRGEAGASEEAQQGSEGDALSQAEEILDAAGAAQEAEASAAEEFKADLLRLQAEFTNYRRRVERDKEAARETGVNATVAALIPVLDDVDAARAAGDLVDGPFASIATKLDAALAALGVERIDQAGVEFDPTVHEALLRQPWPGIEAEHVGQVLRIGFKRGERVLRAAQVLVSTGE
ncbi:MAG: nucleotide exchange factor GrpE [Arthrobacter sp.]|jgi:molecular chaperone GrpE|nr:nucleotide exchange factor GrpE [Arthrobacter sp.]